MANLLPIFSDSGPTIMKGVRDMNSEDELFERPLSPSKEAPRKPKTNTTFRNPKPTNSQRVSQSDRTPFASRADPPVRAVREQVDLTIPNDGSESGLLATNKLLNKAFQTITTLAGDLDMGKDAQAVQMHINTSAKIPKDHRDDTAHATTLSKATLNINPVLDVTPLSDTHVTKFLQEARVQYTSTRPPFVRFKRKALNGPKTVTLAIGKGKLPKIPVTTTLVSRAWDQLTSYYTLDLNGERIIVKPFGGKSYRKWSGHGNVFDIDPVAFVLKADSALQQSKCAADEDELESNNRALSVEDLDAHGEGDNGIMVSGASQLENRAQQEPDLANEAREMSEITAGKRRAPDTIDESRPAKKACPLSANISESSAFARTPTTLDRYKQERTTLHVRLPGSTEIVPIKLSSALTVSTFFCAVCAAAGVNDTKDLAIAVKLRGEDGEEDKTILVKRDIVDSFEFFLEAINEARY